MSTTKVPLRRRLPSPKNDTSFFPSSLRNGEDLENNATSVEKSCSVSICSSPSLIEILKHEVSFDEADEEPSSCLDESDSSKSKSSLESAEEEEDDDSSVGVGENMIGIKILIYPRSDGEDSIMNSLEDDHTLNEDDEKLMSEDEDEKSSSSSEDDEAEEIHDPEDNSDMERVSRIPRSFIAGKKYYGTKQPRSFDSDEMSHDDSFSGDSDSTSSSSSEEGARGLGLALDDALSALSDESYDQAESEFSDFDDDDDDVSTVFQSDDEEDDASDDNYDVNNGKTLLGFQPDFNQSNVGMFVCMDDELHQALDENEADDIGVAENTDFVIPCDHLESSKFHGRKDSISIEDLEEIINESSDSNFDFSDDEQGHESQEETTLTKDKKMISQNIKIKRHHSEGLLSSILCPNQDTFTSPKRFRSSSDTSSSSENESPYRQLLDASLLPPLPWLSIGPSHNSKGGLNTNQQSSSSDLSPREEIPEKEYQEEECQIEFELSEELDYSNNHDISSNEYPAEVIPLLTPPHQPQEELCEWPSNLAVDTALTEAALSLRLLSPKSLQDEDKEEKASVNAVSLDATVSTSRTMSPPPDRKSNFDLHSGLTPRLSGISVAFYGTVHS